MVLSLRNLFRHSSYLYAGQILTSALAFTQGVLIARTLGPAQFGIWAIVTATCATIPAFLGFRTQEPLTRYLVKYRREKKAGLIQILIASALAADFFTRLLSYALIAAVAVWISTHLISESHWVFLFWISGVSVPLGFLESTWYCVARDQKKFKLIALLPVIYALAHWGMILALWYGKSLNLFTLTLSFVIVAVLRMVINFIFLRWLLHKRYGVSFRQLGWMRCIKQRRQVSDFWKFMKATYLSSMVSSLVKTGDILVLGYFRSNVEVGWYRLAKSLVGLLQSFAGTLVSVIYQDLNEILAHPSYQNLKKDLLRLSRVWIPAVLLVTLAGLLLAKPLIGFFYGVNYLPAALAFAFLIPGVAWTVALFWVQPLILALDEYSFNLKAISWVGLVSAAGMVWASFVWGYAGLAAVSSAMWLILYSLLVLRLWPKISK